MSIPPGSLDSPVSILRIKRKRALNSLPLDALLIQPNEPSLKRRRNLGPDDTPSGNRAIFRFAETVSSHSFDTENQTQQITDRITTFARRPPITPTIRRVSSNSQLAQTSPSSPSRKRPSQFNPARTPATDHPATTSPAGRLTDPSSLARRQDKVDGLHHEAKRARYRIIEKSRKLADDGMDGYTGPRPPRVLTASKPNKAQPARIYDAIEDDNNSPSINKPKILQRQADDELMASFVPMLQEYLNLQDTFKATTPTAAVESEDDDEFVYDLYYRSDHPNPASPAIPGAPDDISSLAGLQRIGELAGMDEDEILNDDSSSEEEDEADQDSNEEGDYRNDYPSGDEDEDDQFNSEGDNQSDEWSD